MRKICFLHKYLEISQTESNINIHKYGFAPLFTHIVGKLTLTSDVEEKRIKHICMEIDLMTLLERLTAVVKCLTIVY